jgi:hypothetical protein
LGGNGAAFAPGERKRIHHRGLQQARGGVDPADIAEIDQLLPASHRDVCA